MSLPSVVPSWWEPALIVTVFVAAVSSAMLYVKHVEHVADKAGYDRADGDWKKREAGIAEAARTRAAAETAQARAATTALQEKFDAMADTRQKEKTQHEQDKRNAVAAALAGTERMRIPTGAGSCPVREAGNGQGAATGAGTAAAPSADLLPETAATVLDIAADYGQLVRDYNAVVDRYADAARACNAVTTQPPTGE